MATTSIGAPGVTFPDGSVQTSATNGVPVLNVFTSPGTWTKPGTVKAIKVTVIGGGGSGGYASTPTAVNVSAGGGGGGGGSTIKVYPAASLPGPQPLTVGGAASTSSFGGTAPIISATGGGNGGNAGYATLSIGAAGGAGSGGSLNMSGIPGTNADGPFIQSGFGGGTILSGGAIGTQALPSPGWAAYTGNAGTNYGGGGGGGIINNTPAMNFPGTRYGGTGATGVVIVEEFY